MEGKRKVVVTAMLATIISVFGLLEAFGVQVPEQIYTVFAALAGAFGIGNAGEHIGKGLSRNAPVALMLVVFAVGCGGGTNMVPPSVEWDATVEGDIHFSGQVSANQTGLTSQETEGGGHLTIRLDTQTCFGQEEDSFFCVPAGGWVTVTIQDNSGWFEACYIYPRGPEQMCNRFDLYGDEPVAIISSDISEPWLELNLAALE